MWSEPRRAHPAGIVLFALRNISALIAPVVVVAFIADSGLDYPGAAMGMVLVVAAVALGMIAAVIIAWAQWRRFTFHLEEGALRVERGLLIRRSTRLTPERIQSVDTKANLLFRVLGLVTLDVHTAGKGQEPEVSIPALAEDDAQGLVTALRAAAPVPLEVEVAADEWEGASGAAAGLEEAAAWEGASGAAAAGLEGTAPPGRARTGPAWRLTGRELLTVAATSNAGILALFAITPVLAGLVPVLSESGMIEWFSGRAGLFFVGVFIATSLVTLMSVWLMGSVATLLQYWEFSTVRVNGQVRVEQGLLQRNTRNVPLDRVQAVRLVEGPLRQMIGRVTVGVDSAGLAASNEFGPTVLHPLLTTGDARRFCDLMVPGHAAPPLLPLPERSLRRYLVRAAILPASIALPVAFLVPFGWLALIAPLAALLWARIAYADAAWGLHRDVLGLRWRGLGRTTALVRRRRIQSVAVSQHPLQRRAGLVTLSIQVAASPATAVFTLRHLDESDGMRILEWVAGGVERTGGSV